MDMYCECCDALMHLSWMPKKSAVKHLTYARVQVSALRRASERSETREDRRERGRRAKREGALGAGALLQSVLLRSLTGHSRPRRRGILNLYYSYRSTTRH